MLAIGAIGAAACHDWDEFGGTTGEAGADAGGGGEGGGGDATPTDATSSPGDGATAVDTGALPAFCNGLTGTLLFCSDFEQPTSVEEFDTPLVLGGASLVRTGVVGNAPSPPTTIRVTLPADAGQGGSDRPHYFRGKTQLAVAPNTFARIQLRTHLLVLKEDAKAVAHVVQFNLATSAENLPGHSRVLRIARSPTTTTLEDPTKSTSKALPHLPVGKWTRIDLAMDLAAGLATVSFDGALAGSLDLGGAVVGITAIRQFLGITYSEPTTTGAVFATDDVALSAE